LIDEIRGEDYKNFELSKNIFHEYYKNAFHGDANKRFSFKYFYIAKIVESYEYYKFKSLKKIIF
jgi:hypothetical protein